MINLTKRIERIQEYEQRKASRTRALVFTLILFIALLALYFSGPRPEVQVNLKKVDLPADLNAYLAQSEARYPDIIPGTEKNIVWAHPSKSRTPMAIVYLHGYSATRQETYPLCEKLAARLGANIFYTRLTGHGRSGEALAASGVNDFLNDTLEAVEIGKRLGDRVIVIGTSCGGVLAAWLAAQPGNEEVMLYVLISPAFAFQNPATGLLTGPWAKALARFVFGNEYVRVAANLKEANFWTTRYPPEGLIAPVLLAQFVQQSDLEKVRQPVLVIYSPLDRLLNHAATNRVFARLGSAVKKIVPVMNSDNPEYHVLAGDILAPHDTDGIVEIITEFISGL